MMRSVRLLLPLLLVLSLVGTGQAIAAAKGANPATGVMTLCVGKGMIVVFTDADGQPTQAPHVCPDCALAALSGPVPPDVLPTGLALRAVAKARADDPRVPWQTFGYLRLPRGPPASV